ncbi:hypothetical protein [Planotetraspora silvatica]|nr:hypothetical protein [Planotetraspora silvatica]
MRRYLRHFVVAALIGAGVIAGVVAAGPTPHDEAAQSPYISCC